jgi:inner membrane protein
VGADGSGALDGQASPFGIGDMCTPIGHTLVGAAIYQVGLKKEAFHPGWFFFILLCACLPDIDFLFGYLSGNPNLFHHMWTHSLIFGVLLGLLTAIVSWPFLGARAFRIGFLAFGAVLSHLVLDYFTVDQNPPYGIKLFWPFTQKYYISSVPVFQDVYKASTSSGFLGSLFCRYNLGTVLTEMLILGPFLLLICLQNKKKI